MLKAMNVMDTANCGKKFVACKMELFNSIEEYKSICHIASFLLRLRLFFSTFRNLKGLGQHVIQFRLL